MRTTSLSNQSTEAAHWEDHNQVLGPSLEVSATTGTDGNG